MRNKDRMKGASGNSIDHATASRYLKGMVDNGLNKLGYEYVVACNCNQPLRDGSTSHEDFVFVLLLFKSVYPSSRSLTLYFTDIY